MLYEKPSVVETGGYFLFFGRSGAKVEFVNMSIHLLRIVDNMKHIVRTGLKRVRHLG